MSVTVVAVVDQEKEVGISKKKGEPVNGKGKEGHRQEYAHY